MPFFDKTQVISSAFFANDYKNLVKLEPTKLLGYKSILEDISKKIDNRINNTVDEMIDLKYKMSYVPEEHRNDISYKMFENKWEINNQRLIELQNDQRTIKHEIERVTILMYENPAIIKCSP